jgi:hypothetical protein
MPTYFSSNRSTNTMSRETIVPQTTTRSKTTPRTMAVARGRSHAIVLGAAALGAVVLSSSRPAQAHIKLIEPASWVVEDAQGNPQKTGPCGGTGVTETGAVTTFRAGEEITVSWQETVGHSGHFRISLATDRADLIDPPVVTVNGDGVSGNSISAEIMNPVAYPVLVDNLFPRDTVSGAATEPFTTTVTLPDEPCESCTLQVIQFMSQHGPGYFYHHCANVRIVAADAELPTDQAATGAAGSANAGQAGSPGNTRPAAIGSGGAAGSAAARAGSGAVSDSDDDSDDGGCSVASRNPARISRAIMSALTLVGIASLWRRRRRNLR